MNLTVSGHHVAVTPAIRGYIESKLVRIRRHFDHVVDVNVILTVEKLHQKAEATCHVRGKEIHAESDDPDLYAAIDSLADKLDRQILKYKNQRQAHAHEAPKRQPALDQGE